MGFGDVVNELSVKAPKGFGALTDIGFDIDKEYSKLSQAETISEKDPWIRTRVQPEAGSSAYGPVQTTKGLAIGALKNKYFKEDKELQNWVKDKFIPHGELLLKHGKMKGKIPDYEERYDYGGIGDFSERDKVMYEKMNKAILKKEFEENPELDVPKYWYGKEPSKEYRERYNLTDTTRPQATVLSKVAPELERSLKSRFAGRPQIQLPEAQIAPKSSILQELTKFAGATPITLPQMLFKEKFATPKQKSFMQHLETAIVMPAFEAVQLAEQIGVPLAKGEKIDVFGKERSITEFPKIKKMLSDVSKAGAKIGAAVTPGLGLVQRPIGEAIKRAPEEPFAEAGRFGAKILLTRGIMKGIEALARADQKAVLNTIESYWKDKAIKAGMPNDKADVLGKMSAQYTSRQQMRVPEELIKKLRFRHAPLLAGEKGFALVPGKRENLIKAIQKVTPAVSKIELTAMPIAQLQALHSQTVGKVPAQAPKVQPTPIEVTKKPIAEPVADKARIQEIKNSIAEGEMILKSGKNVAGEKMSPTELDVVRMSIESAKAKIGIEPEKLPPHLQKIVDKQKEFEITDVTPEGYGPEILPTKPVEPVKFAGKAYVPKTYSGLVSRMRKKTPGIGLDDIAKTLQTDGVLKVPVERMPDDYLKELIDTGAKLPVEPTKAVISGIEKQQIKVERELLKREKEAGVDFDVLALEKPKKVIKPVEISSPEGKEVARAYEKQKDIWFGKKDVRVFQAKVENQKLQAELKTSLDQKNYTDEVKNYDKAIQLYIDTKRNPEHIAKYFKELTPEQHKVLELSQDLPPNVKVIADKMESSYKAIGLEAQSHDIIRNVLDNYAGRIWDIKGKKGLEAMRKFGTTTRHAKARKFDTIIEGWASGMDLKVEGATNNLAILKEEMIKTIEDKKFIKSLQKLKTMNGEPLLSSQMLDGYKQVEHSNFKMWKWAGTAEEGKVYGRNFFIDDEGNLFEKHALYAPESIANNMNNILGISKLKGIPFVDALTKFNATTKAWILQSSLFHHMAFTRSYWFGTQGKKWSELSPRQAYRQGLQMIEEESPIILQGVKNGLTLGLKQDWNEELLREKGIISKTLDKWMVSKVVKDKIMGFREAQADFLFGKLGAGLKAKAFVIEYRNLLRKHPDMDSDKAAKIVANLINDDFGGLHLQRMGRNPTVQHLFRLFALAPDWTESNIRTMVKAIKAGGKEEQETYRRFWAGIFTKAVGMSVLANMLMATLDEDDETTRNAWQRFIRNYKRAWSEGKFRVLEVDITPLYTALGGKTEKRKYFSVLGHFKDPLKFIFHPVRSAHHKGSVVYRFFHEALTGVDWAGRRFTKADELAGLDYQKGKYKTTRKGKYKKGDPKWGKLKGKTVTWDFTGKGPLGYSQIPSFILHQIKSWQPIQIQNLMSWWAGEQEGFDAIGKSLGLRVGTTYGEKPKKFSGKSKKRGFGSVR